MCVCVCEAILCRPPIWRILCDRSVAQALWAIVGVSLMPCFSFPGDPTRSVAGLLLKNNVKKYYESMPADVKEYMRVACLESLGDQSPLIRATVGILLSTLVQKMTECGELAQPEMLVALVQCLDSPTYNVVEVRHRTTCEAISITIKLRGRFLSQQLFACPPFIA